jgi:hypothetical protein
MKIDKENFIEGDFVITLKDTITLKKGKIYQVIRADRSRDMVFIKKDGIETGYYPWKFRKINKIHKEFAELLYKE